MIHILLGGFNKDCTCWHKNLFWSKHWDPARRIVLPDRRWSRLRSRCSSQAIYSWEAGFPCWLEGTFESRASSHGNDWPPCRIWPASSACRRFRKKARKAEPPDKLCPEDFEKAFSHSTICPIFQIGFAAEQRICSEARDGQPMRAWSTTQPFLWQFRYPHFLLYARWAVWKNGSGFPDQEDREGWKKRKIRGM